MNFHASPFRRTVQKEKGESRRGEFLSKNLFFRGKTAAGILFLFGIGLAMTLLFLRGTRPIEVLSSSMSPDYQGPAWRLRCPKCGELFRLTVDYPFGEKRTSARWTECPNCGFSEVPVTDKSFQAGELVRIKSRWGSFPPLQRWEAVAFKLSEGNETNQDKSSDADFLTLKRIIGLPGETVRIDRGDLWINGTVISKDDFWQERDLRLPRLKLTPVFQEGCVLFQNLRPLPYLEGEKSDSANSSDSPPKTPFPIQNLPPNPRFEPIAEDRLEYVRDFIIEIPFSFLENPPRMDKVSSSEASFLTFTVNQGNKFGRVDLNWESVSVGFIKNPRPDEGETPFFQLTASSFESAKFLPIKLPKITSGNQNKDKDDEDKKTEKFLRLIFCDRQFICQIVDFQGVRSIAKIQENAWGEIVSSPSALKKNLPITTPFALLGKSENGPENFKERLSSVRFYRDLHYSAGEGETSAFTIPKGEYLLLGDNSAVSWDARHWKKKTVPRSKIWKIKKRESFQNSEF